jgi:hypothetical protein
MTAMGILSKLRSIEFDRNRNGIFGIKSAIIWGHHKDTNSSSALLYLTKPKHISNEDYNEMINSINISFTIKDNGKED